MAELSAGTEWDSFAAPVISYGPAEELSTAWTAGCSDYLKDPWSMTELHFRISRLLSAPGRTVKAGNLQVTDAAIRCGEREIQISAQERKILNLLLRHPGVVAPREALYYAIWGKQAADSRAVDVHISRLRAKLSEIQTDVEETDRVVIQTVRGEGYIIYT